MASSNNLCEGNDVDQEALTGDIIPGEAEIPFEISTESRYNIHEVSYLLYPFIVYLCSCIHLVLFYL